MDNRKPPQIITALEITDMASEGMGLAKQDGLVIFVENTITGDIVDVMITRKKSGFRQGKPIHFHKYS
jgi:23S rRNA (uracil1939-C5)-methyltransferase